MGKGKSCFYCENHFNAHIEKPGWSHDCKEGIDNSNLNNGIEDVVNCPKGKPQFGFQIGGYYTHMVFQKNSECLTWIIKSDGCFPTDDENEQIKFHVCNFKQIERFVEFWGNYLRKKHII